MTTPLARKLRLHVATRALLLVPEEYRAPLEPLPAGVATVAAGESCDFVLAFLRESAAIPATVPAITAGTVPDAIIWLAYPKGGAKAGTDLNRDRLWRAIAPYGLRPVSQVAIDEVWSALRFRPLRAGETPDHPRGAGD